MALQGGGLLMRKLTVTGLLCAVMLVGCTHMDGIVKEIKFNKEGDLVLTKCDEKIYWNLYFVAWGEGDCREEVKSKPAKR